MAYDVIRPRKGPPVTSCSGNCSLLMQVQQLYCPHQSERQHTSRRLAAFAHARDYRELKERPCQRHVCPAPLCLTPHLFEGSMERTFGYSLKIIIASTSHVCLYILSFLIGRVWLGNVSPRQRRRTVSPGDALLALALGEYIESATGSRLLGWNPWASTTARLSVTWDGRMVAKKPNGAEVRCELESLLYV